MRSAAVAAAAATGSLSLTVRHSCLRRPFSRRFLVELLPLRHWHLLLSEYKQATTTPTNRHWATQPETVYTRLSRGYN